MSVCGPHAPFDQAVAGVWQFIGVFDLFTLLAAVKALPAKAGAAALEQRILITPWRQATPKGISSEVSVRRLI